MNRVKLVVDVQGGIVDAVYIDGWPQGVEFDVYVRDEDDNAEERVVITKHNLIADNPAFVAQVEKEWEVK